MGVLSMDKRNFFEMDQERNPMSLKKFALTLAVFAFPAVANAADIAPAPAYNWTGFYMGLNAGYAWSDVDMSGHDSYANLDLNLAAEASRASARGASDNLQPDGFIGGGQLGYNYDVGNGFLIGLEADIQYMGGDDSSSTVGEDAGLPGYEYQSKNEANIDYLGTLRARMGFLVSPSVLAYATGGLAYGGGSVSVKQSLVPAGYTQNPFSGNSDFNNFGWTVGGGLEWVMSDHFSVKAEYLYYDLGSTDFKLNQYNLDNDLFITTKVDADITGNIARVGFNYRFN